MQKNILGPDATMIQSSGHLAAGKRRRTGALHPRGKLVVHTAAQPSGGGTVDEPVGMPVTCVLDQEGSWSIYDFGQRLSRRNDHRHGIVWVHLWKNGAAGSSQS